MKTGKRRRDRGVRATRLLSARARRALSTCADTAGLQGSRRFAGARALCARDSRTLSTRFRCARSPRARYARACRVRSPRALSPCALAVRSPRALSEHSRRVRSLARARSCLLAARHHRRARGRAERVGRVDAREAVFAEQRAHVPGEEQGASVRRRHSAGRGGAVHQRAMPRWGSHASAFPAVSEHSAAHALFLLSGHALPASRGIFTGQAGSGITRGTTTHGIVPNSTASARMSSAITSST